MFGITRSSHAKRMNRPTTCAFLLLQLAVACPAQGGAAPDKQKLRIESDPEDLVATKLQGNWTLDRTLTTRLGAKSPIENVAFTRTDEIVDGIPEAITAKLAKLPLHAAGTMVLGGATYPFLLVSVKGNKQVVYFRERDGNPVGDAESFIVTLASAKDASQDILFVGGDFSKTPFHAFVRGEAGSAKPKGNARSITTPEGAIADIARLLREKQYFEMIQTYMSPQEKERFVKRKGNEESLEQLAESFGNKKAAELLALLESLADKKPELSADGMTAKYQGDKGGRELVLIKVGERWYIKN